MNPSRTVSWGIALISIAVGLAVMITASFLFLPFVRVESAGASSMNVMTVPVYAAAVGLPSILAAVYAARHLHRRFFMMRNQIVDAASDAIETAIVVLDEKDRYFYMNARAEKILGVNRGEVFGAAANSALFTQDAASPISLAGRDYRTDSRNIDLRESGGMGKIFIARDVTGQRNVEKAVKKIVDAILALEAQTRRITDASTKLSQGAARETASLSAVASSMGEINSRSRDCSDAISQGTQLAAKTREAAERSGMEIASALAAMADVQEAGASIARIVKIIDDIAFQTNLLALNAAVEAARAGPQGKGFAVVADEVRNLSGRSARAAQDTASLIENVTERLGNAGAFITRLDGMLKNIVQDAILMADVTASATAAAREQTEGVQKVDEELHQFDAMAHDAIAVAADFAEASRTLSRNVADLRTSTDFMAAAMNAEESIPDAANQDAAFLNAAPNPAGKAPASTIPESGQRFSTAHVFAGIDDSTSRAWGAEAWKPQKKTQYASDGSEPDRGRGKRVDDGQPHQRDAGWFDAGVAERRIEGMRPAAKSENDEVVLPTQKIILDDAEFGRY